MRQPLTPTRCVPTRSPVPSQSDLHCPSVAPFCPVRAFTFARVAWQVYATTHAGPGATAVADEPAAASPADSLARRQWEADVLRMACTADLFYSNQIAEAEVLCREGAEAMVPKGEGVRDLRGVFAICGALFAVALGVARGEKEQLRTVLPRLQAADALLAHAEPWARVPCRLTASVFAHHDRCQLHRVVFWGLGQVVGGL